MMTERIKQFRQQSLYAINTLSAERALLVTDFYGNADRQLPAPILRAKAFEHIMLNKKNLHKFWRANCGRTRSSAKGRTQLPRSLPS